MNRYALAEEGNRYTEIEAENLLVALEAAKKGVDPSCYGGSRYTTLWVHVTATALDTDEGYLTATVTCEPQEPPCISGKAHTWQQPLLVVGGLRENPGVYGHGGGTVSFAACCHCGMYRIYDTWATDPATGLQGLHETRYGEPNERSRSWVQEQ